MKKTKQHFHIKIAYVVSPIFAFSVGMFHSWKGGIKPFS